MTRSTSLITDVADTAFMIAAYRAIETERADALFRDPLAARLAGEKGQAFIASLSGMARLTAWTVAIRTVIIDAFIQTAIEQGVDTVLNLGAGLDTRPYRLLLPASLSWIEVDQPRIIALKESQLANEHPVCRLERIALDLADRPARRAMMSTIAARSTNVLVLTEGVVPYLRMEEAASLADDLASHPAVRYWVVDYFSPATYKYRERTAVKRQLQNVPFRFQPKDYWAFFDEHGWTATEIRYIPEESERLGRPMPVPLLMKAWMTIAGLVASREKRRAFRTFMGYVLFEPLVPAGPPG